MKQLSVRRATTQDLKILRRFEQGVIDAELPFDSTLKTRGPRYDLEKMLTSPEILLVVGEINHAVIACGYARIENTKPFLQHEKQCHLGFMYVVPEHRGQGCIREISAFLMDWSAAQKVMEVRLDVYVGNDPALKAYEKMGFSQQMIEMRMSLKK